MDQPNYIRVRDSQINYYVEVPLYHQTVKNYYCLYKPAGTKLAEIRLNQKRHPQLFIQETDRRFAD